VLAIFEHICNAGVALHAPVKQEANIIGNPIDAKMPQQI
jgi:hypothetical protein